MIAHFKAKIHETTKESPKSDVVKVQMSAIPWHSEVMGKGVIQKDFSWNSVIHGWKAWKQENLMVKSKKCLGLPFGVHNLFNTLVAETRLSGHCILLAC